jgi:hypothetical protein
MPDARPARRRISPEHNRNGDSVRAPNRYDSAPIEGKKANRIVVDDWPDGGLK